MPKSFRKMARKAGLPPGSLVYTGEQPEAPARIVITRYNDQVFSENEFESISACPLVADEDVVTWIDVSGIHQVQNLEKLGECFHLHPLVLEDILETEQRPKIEDYDDYLYIVLTAINPAGKAEELESEQISLILGPHYVISFHESNGRLFAPIREGSWRPKAGSGKWGPIISPMPSSTSSWIITSWSWKNSATRWSFWKTTWSADPRPKLYGTCTGSKMT